MKNNLIKKLHIKLKTKIEIIHLLIGTFWSSVYTHISGFAVKGLLRCCFQGADVEHRMAIAISTKHTKQTSVC